MSPNEVKALLDALIVDLGLPIRALDSGPQVVIEKSNGPTRSRTEEVVKQWMNGCGRSHSIYVGQSAANVEKGITLLASETYRVPEIKEILKSLIEEQSLPLNIVDWGFELQVLADEGIDYRDDDMAELEALLEAEELDVPVRHRGFSLWQEGDNAVPQFSKFETLANRLQSQLNGHGLQVRLLHKGFELQKDAEDEVDIAEAKELTYRLEIMVGIRYVQGGYSYANDAENPEIHWQSAHVVTALPVL